MGAVESRYMLVAWPSVAYSPIRAPGSEATVVSACVCLQLLCAEIVAKSLEGSANEPLSLLRPVF